MLEKTFSLVLVTGVTGALLVCSAQPAKDKFIKIYLSEGSSITAELAVTAEERARGLMFRERLLPDQGMLFVFEVEDYHSFWMKNTLVALDMVWLDKEKRIVHIERDVPPCQADPCPSYTPKRPGSYVLELKSGSADRLKLRLYDRLEFALPASKIR
jgi:uncharacterized membrane protein (UPF0127 family)